MEYFKKMRNSLYKICTTILFVTAYYILFFMNFNAFNFSGGYCCFVLAVIVYVVVILAVKIIASIFFVTKCSLFIYNNDFCFGNIVHYIPLLLLSPDYVAVKILDSIFNFDMFKKKNLVMLYNFLNFLITLVSFIVLIFYPSCKFFYMLLFVRFVSRFFEIVISFVFDVISERKSSALETKNRILLAIISFVEYYLLAIAIFAIYHNSQINFDIISSFLNNLISVCSCECCSTNTAFDIFLIVISSIFNVTMLTFVIGNYVGNRKDKESYIVCKYLNKTKSSIKIGVSLDYLKEIIIKDLKTINKLIYIYKFDRYRFKCNNIESALDKTLLPSYLIMNKNETVGFIYVIPLCCRQDIDSKLIQFRSKKKPKTKNK